MKRMMLQTYSLWLRDLRHFFRQKSRVAGAVGQPILIWVLLASGFHGSFLVPGGASGFSYGEYLFPGVMVLIALFAAIFSTISIIEDRKSGFLQGVMVAPVSRPVLVFAKLLAGATLGMMQAVLFLLLLPFTSLPISPVSVAAGLLVLLFIGLTMTNLGFLLAWRMKSTQGFHAIMALALIPLWILSGAFFPVEGASGWMQWLVLLNPVHYMTSLFQQTFSPALFAGINAPDVATAWAVSLLFFLTLFTASIRIAKR